MDFVKSFEAGGYMIVASPERMRDTTSKLRSICCELREHICSAQSYVVSAKQIWDASSYDLLREIYLDEIAEYETFERRITETVEDLDRIIDIYKITEDGNAQEAAVLSGSVFQ